MIWTTLIMALREIRRNTMRSILTTLGIVIGVASVIAMITLGRGATARITADIAAMGNNLLILVPGADRRGPAAQTAQAFKVEDAKAIEREATAVADVAPSATRTQMVVYGDKNWSTAITGATNAYFDVRGYVFSRGGGFSDVETTTGAAVCVLGETVRRELFGLEESIGATIRAGNIACRVIGTLETKGQSSFGLDQDDFVTIPLATFQRRIAGNNDVGAIFVNAVSDKDTTRATEQIQSLMRERRHIRPGAADDFMVQDMKEITKTLGSVTQALTGLLGAIAGVSLLVGGIGIMNIMLVSVTERTRENRHPARHRSEGARGPPAVPRRGRDPLEPRGARRSGPRPGWFVRRGAGLPFALHGDAGHLDARVRLLHCGRDRVRVLSGAEGGAAEPDRGVAP